ncbi:hypothetical protein, partial [Pleionea mediterranea]|uniref:hypothetical protein n=1 Tax=Pleionea mediterranea TaxID=523701 RepID=UPI001AED0BD8
VIDFIALSAHTNYFINLLKNMLIRNLPDQLNVAFSTLGRELYATQTSCQHFILCLFCFLQNRLKTDLDSSLKKACCPKRDAHYKD